VSIPHPASGHVDSLAPARSALGGLSAPPNSFRRFPNGESPPSDGEGRINVGPTRGGWTDTAYCDQSSRRDLSRFHPKLGVKTPDFSHSVAPRRSGTTTCKAEALRAGGGGGLATRRRQPPSATVASQPRRSGSAALPS